MRILYGVQGTGNGHLTRALAMATAFESCPELKVDFLLSGRKRAKLFGVDALGDFSWRAGLSFATRGGRVSIRDTLSQNPWWRFWQDVHELDLSGYDLVVTDFEPVSAWAARRQGVRCIGLGRQYAFWQGHHALPVNPLQRAMIRQFAPCDEALGTHWSPLNSSTLPPLIAPVGELGSAQSKRYLVYLPFEPLADIDVLLQALPEYQFDVFHPEATPRVTANATYFAPSREGFRHAFSKAEGIIANAGFGTSSEALASGKKLLVKPLQGQFEQVANAHCLQHEGLAGVCQHLEPERVHRWIQSPSHARLQWPDVSQHVAKWIATGAKTPVAHLSQQLWQQSGLQRQTA
ncbi:glycosyltransferase family protein [Aliidiomarina soli]|uniref:Glycosyltransferase n=1 Tax=Aliidiomarina soli TaxID=1928574 RepID=A0A432WIS5_9GAMM|nr:glycosyltransferase family protein [Aliidiomarina soli]RUO33611.1 glycosyltransferase [Aliidiomarina soli]